MSPLKTGIHGNDDKPLFFAHSPLVSQTAFKANTTVRLATTKSYDFLNRLTSINSAGSGANPAMASFDCAYNNTNFTP